MINLIWIFSVSRSWWFRYNFKFKSKYSFIIKWIIVVPFLILILLNLAQSKAVPALEMPVPNEILQLVNNLK